MVLDVVRIEHHVNSGYYRVPGRPLADRQAIARAFVAKATMNLPTTVMLLDRLESDAQLRRICGWEKRQEIPDESTFSRAFKEFATSRLPERVHAALVSRDTKDPLVGHISRDSTEIEAREKPMPKQEQDCEKHEQQQSDEKHKRKRGRPKKGETILKKISRLEAQSQMTLPQMLDDLPKVCDIGVKRNSKGHQEKWIGYKLHIDTADGGIPISCILTSASVHDSQASIPLAIMTEQRVVYLYELMDSAYDSKEIKEYSLSHGHVPIIDINPRNNKLLHDELAAEEKALRTIHMKLAEDRRYNERTTAERTNGRLKDEFGGKMVRVRGHAKVMCHLMFGVLSLTADQLIRMVT
ncbi:MAG: transposase [Magnetococcales bacterium]|nr:transposase [Magnetococcales bacterium]